MNNIKNSDEATITYGEVKRILFGGVLLGFVLGFATCVWMMG